MIRTKDLSKAVAAVANQAEQTELSPEHIRLTADDIESIEQQKVMLTAAANQLEETPYGQAA